MKMIPTIAVTFVVASQNSISPYLRTLKRLNTISIAPKLDIHTLGLTCVLGTQKVIALATATSFAGSPTNSLTLVDHVKTVYVTQ